MSVTRKLNRGRFLVALLILAAAAVILQSTASRGQGQQPTVKLQPEPVQQTNEVSGPKLFHSYCAVCHGDDGKGRGAAAPALKTPPADLTVLARNNGGRFPANHVMDVLSSSADFTAHGSTEMPVWGPVFRSMGANPSLATLRAKNLTDYLRSLQEK
jgi:mono/diheme cytochrome c family protein